MDKRPDSREDALAKQAVLSKACVEKRRLPGGAQPLLQVLLRACDRAASGTLNAKALRRGIDHCLSYLEYLRADRVVDGTVMAPWGEARAFDPEVVLAYQDWVANLAKTRSVQPGRVKPAPRVAQAGEERLDLITQQIKVRGIGYAWEVARAHADLAARFTPMPFFDPTKVLTWKRRAEKPKSGIAFSLEALWATPFVAGHRKSLVTHERNLLHATLHACCPTRTNELRRARWSDLEIWEVAEGQELPLARWPLEAAFTGEVALDDDRFVLFLTFDEDSSKTEWKTIPVVGVAREKLLAFALHSLDAQMESLRYLRYRSRHELPAALRVASGSFATELLMNGEVISIRKLIADKALWRRARTFGGPGYLHGPRGAEKLEPKHAAAFRTVLWSIAAVSHFKAIQAAFNSGTPIRGAFEGVILASSEGGPLSDAQIDTIWNGYGWNAKGWSPQDLRRNAARAFERIRLRALAPLGPVIGHRNPATTLDHYAFPEPWVKATVARLLVGELIAQGLVYRGAATRVRLEAPKTADTGARFEVIAPEGPN